MDRFVPPSFGWRPDMPDFRDFTPDNPSVGEMLAARGCHAPDVAAGAQAARRPAGILFRASRSRLASVVMRRCLRGTCRIFRVPVERPCDPAIEAISTRELRSGWRWDRCDSAVNLRSTLKAIAACGLPPERLWPYEPSMADVQPEPFLYSFAARFREVSYVRLGARNAAQRRDS